MKKKIAFYIESMVVGGAERVLIDTVNHLNYSKYDVTVISIFKESVYNGYTVQFSDSFNERVHYKYLIDNTNKWKYRLFNYVYAHFDKSKIYSFLIKEKYDIEIAYYEGFPTEFVSYSTQKSKKIAWLHTDNTRLYNNRTDVYISEKRSIYNQFNQVVGVSGIVSHSFERYFPGLKAQTVFNVFDVEKIESRVKEPCGLSPFDGVTFLCVGRLIPIKGYDRILRVIIRLSCKYKGFRFVFIGEGSMETELKAFADKYAIQDYVIFEGLKDNPYSYMAQADYFVCASLAEGFSTVVVESILCNLPVLTTRCAGMEEIFGDFCCGAICENSEDGLYEMLRYQLDHPEFRDMYIKECIKRKEFFSIEKRIKDVETVYDEVL